MTNEYQIGHQVGVMEAQTHVHACSLLVELQPKKILGPYLHVFFKMKVKSKSKCQENEIK